MKDIISDYYDKYYGRNRVNSFHNATLLTEATRSITNYNNKKTFKTVSNRNCISLNQNRQYCRLTALPVITYDNTTNELIKNRDNSNTNNNLFIKSRKYKTSLEEEKSIKNEAKKRIEELLGTNNNETKDNNNNNQNNEDILNNQIKYAKEDQVDKLFYIKENIALEPNNLNILKSKKIQLSIDIYSVYLILILLGCFHDELHRINLMNGVKNYELKCIKYHSLKTPLIGKNRYKKEKQSNLFKNLVGDSQPLNNNTNTKKIQSMNVYNIESNEEREIFLLKGLDTRINQNLTISKNIYDKISMNRIILKNKKNEIIDLLYK